MFKTTLSLSTVAAGLLSFAQTPSPQSAPAPPATAEHNFVYATGGVAMPGAGGGAIGFIAHEFSFNSGKPVAGAPYSAEQVTEHVQILADENRIVNTTTTKMYRDSQGRTRTETTLPSFAGGPTPPVLVTISDPVAGVTYMLNSDNKTAQKLTMKPFDSAKQKALPPLPPLPGGPGIGPVVITAQTGLPKAAAKTEDLGTHDVNGILAAGTRVTETIPAGAIGNELPIETVSERWFSPDLQIMVKSVHTDPRMGQTTETLNNVNRSEPDASLFRVPADYTVVEPKVPDTKTVIFKQPQ
jgi:hypothetical protein